MDKNKIQHNSQGFRTDNIVDIAGISVTIFFNSCEKVETKIYSNLKF